MSSEQKIEEESERPSAERRPYEPPRVRDFFQPLVVLGTVLQTTNCASPKPPKH